MGEEKLAKITKGILDFMFYSGIAVCLTLPITTKIIGKYYKTFEEHYVSMNILFFISGVLAVLIVEELRRMFDTVVRKDCFVQENVRSLSRMGNYSFLISAVTFIRLFFVITPATLVIILVFLIAGLFSKVLSRVFGEAVTYKQENDLTI